MANSHHHLYLCDLLLYRSLLNLVGAMSYNPTCSSRSNLPLMTNAEYRMFEEMNNDLDDIEEDETPKRKKKMKERLTPAQYQEGFRLRLMTDIVTFNYTKKNGKSRHAVGTTCLDFVPTDMLPKGIGSERPEGYVNYYDFTVCGWRTVRLKHVTSYVLK